MEFLKIVGRQPACLNLPPTCWLHLVISTLHCPPFIEDSFEQLTDLPPSNTLEGNLFCAVHHPNHSPMVRTIHQSNRSPIEPFTNQVHAILVEPFTNLQYWWLVRTIAALMVSSTIATTQGATDML